MTQTWNCLLDDLAKVASGALSAATGVKDEAEVLFRQKIERVFASLELVSREEFEVVKAMAAKARAEQEDLAARLKALEAEVSAAKPDAARKSRATAKPAGPAKAKAAPSKRDSSGSKPAKG